MAKKIIVVLFVFLAGVAIVYGCKGSKTRKAAEEIRDEVTGNRVLQQGQEIKEDIKDIEKQNAERLENHKKQAGDIE